MKRFKSFIMHALAWLLYPLLVVVAVLLLASAQMRSSAGLAFDTWLLSYDANKALIENHEEQLKNLREEKQKSDQNLAHVNVCIGLYDQTTGKLIEGKVDQQLLQSAEQAKKAGKKPEDFAGVMWCLMSGPAELNLQKATRESENTRYKEQTSDLVALLSSEKAMQSDLIKDHREFLAFKEMEKNWYTKLVVDTPYDLLVLLLVMSMGALGGMARILRDYGDASRKNPAAKDYVFIPLIGIVIALGGYVLAKTGLLLLSSAKEETSLSPFMIGLVGIVSGLMAREVIDAIARAGANMLKGKAGADEKAKAEAEEKAKAEAEEKAKKEAEEKTKKEAEEKPKV
jgi:hypothetical protein